MKFAIVDFESTSLKSDKGFLLCGGIKELGKKGRIIGLREAWFGKDRLRIDEKLALAIRAEMEQYDGWITWNGKKFDLPLINDRLLFAGHSPVERRFHMDMLWYVKQFQSCLTSGRLDWVARMLKVPSEKTSLDISTWNLAESEAIEHFKTGSKNYDYIVKHCLADLEVTEQVYERLKPRVRCITK